MKVKELIKELEKYDPNLNVCAGVLEGYSLGHYEMKIIESHELGDRCAEANKLIVIASDLNWLLKDQSINIEE